MRALILLCYAILWLNPALGQQPAQKMAVAPYDLKMFEVPEHGVPGATDYRLHWQRLTGFEYSGLHWNQFILIYTNRGMETYRRNYRDYLTWFEDPDAEDSLPTYASYEPGTVFFKENYSSKDGKPYQPLSITAMRKHPAGFDPEGGDWEYLQMAEGKVLLQGKGSDPAVAKKCAGCHQNVAERDYIFAHFFSVTLE